MSIVIGIHCGHDASVSILKNGKNIFSLSEERLSRIKNHIGIPFLAIHYIFKHSIVNPEQVKSVAFWDHNISYLFKNQKLSLLKKILNKKTYKQKLLE